jgi:hypothetical protein
LANCIAHERCPACAKRGRDRSGNNLGVYDDGSKYCFSCHYRTGNSLDFSFDVGKSVLQGEKRSMEKSSLVLPADATSIQTSERGLDWILQWGLTGKEISDNLILFSEKGIYLQRKNETVDQLVIFPIYGNADELLFWTGRSLSYNGTGTKWVIKGKPTEVVHGVYPAVWYSKANQASCCVCEDIISTIKLGRIIPTFTLFGKNINDRLLRYLSSNFYELLIYLDYDAINESYNLQKKVSPYFSKVIVICSELDPKCYETNELREIIR